MKYHPTLFEQLSDLCLEMAFPAALLILAILLACLISCAPDIEGKFESSGVSIALDTQTITLPGDSAGACFLNCPSEGVESVGCYNSSGQFIAVARIVRPDGLCGCLADTWHELCPPKEVANVLPSD
jgi:hypothetical protein